jgi:hypothetical protein
VSAGGFEPLEQKHTDHWSLEISIPRMEVTKNNWNHQGGSNILEKTTPECLWIFMVENFPTCPPKTTQSCPSNTMQLDMEHMEHMGLVARNHSISGWYWNNKTTNESSSSYKAIWMYVYYIYIYVYIYIYIHILSWGNTKTPVRLISVKPTKVR